MLVSHLIFTLFRKTFTRVEWGESVRLHRYIKCFCHTSSGCQIETHFCWWQPIIFLMEITRRPSPKIRFIIRSQECVQKQPALKCTRDQFKADCCIGERIEFFIGRILLNYGYYLECGSRVGFEKTFPITREI